MSARLLRFVWLVPPLILAAFVWHFGVDVPVFDQWELVPQLEKWSAGTLGLADLLVPQNEHRLFFPRALMVGMAALSHWNIRWELAATFVFAAGIAAVIALRLRKLGLAWVLPLASLLIFSFTQKENWLWGWQLQIALVTLAAVAAVAILARERVGTAGVAAAAAVAVVATFSFANGLAVFPVGLVVLWLVGRAQPVRVAILVAVGAAATGLYLHGYRQVVGHPPASYVLHHPLDGLLYALAFLGSPLGFGFGEVSVVFGALGAAAFVWLVRARHRDGAREHVALAVGLAGWAVASAAITAIGRAGFGIAQATSSRYATIATPFWLGLIVLAAGHSRARRPVIAALALISLVAYADAGKWAVYDAAERRASRDLLRDDPERGLLRVYPGDGRSFLRARLEFLRTHRLSLFRQ